MIRPSCSTCKWSSNPQAAWGRCDNPDLIAFNEVKGHYKPFLRDALDVCKFSKWAQIPHKPLPTPKRVHPLIWAILKPFIGDVK